MTAFTGTGTLIRLALRRDRIQLPVWLIALTLVQAATVSSVLGLYTDEAQRLTLAIASARSPVSLVFNGIVSGAGVGATVMTQSFMVVAVAAGLMSTLCVIRHTRQNEETGRAEIVGSGVVGRHAGLTAALLVAVGANVVLGLLTALVLIANDLPVDGSLVAGAGIAAVGIAFAAVAAIAAQIAQTARAANGLAAIAVGVAFLLRAVGDLAGEVTTGGTRSVSAWPSWLSPIGWGQQMRPYDDNNWDVLGLLGAAFVGLVGLAFALTAHRDSGAGMLPERPGPATAPRGLLSPLGLAWRLQRGVLLGWAVAIVVAGGAYGGVGNELEEMLGGSDRAAELFQQLGGGGGSLRDAYFAAIIGMIGLLSTGYAVQALLRMRAEEAGGSLEPVLATAVSKPRWMLSHITVAALGTTALLLLAGLSAGLTYGLVAGGVSRSMTELAGAALVQAPAALVLAGFVVAVFGLAPRAAVALSWAGFAVCLLLGQLGAVLDLPDVVLDLSPFTHLPRVPTAEVTAAPLLTLLVVAGTLTATGIALFRRRDLAL
ncbi:MAG: ABC transporter permease, partial [Pseudonocardiaceae bacterium]